MNDHEQLLERLEGQAMSRRGFVAGTTALSGVRNLSTKAGAGVVVQHVGHVVVGPDGEPVTLRGKFPEFEAAYMDQDFCAALA